MSKLLLRQGDIHFRRDFGSLLNRLQQFDHAVEIGTHRGDFAATLLMAWKGPKLWCVDPYEHLYDPTDPAALGDRNSVRRQAENRLGPFGGRVEILAERSLDAAGRFADESLSFVYVDGCHQTEDTAADLNAWWPKVRIGGILAGHDILCPAAPLGLWEHTVQPAVFEFTQTVDHTLFLVKEDGEQPWSYYFRKVHA